MGILAGILVGVVVGILVFFEPPFSAVVCCICRLGSTFASKCLSMLPSEVCFSNAAYRLPLSRAFLEPHGRLLAPRYSRSGVSRARLWLLLSALSPNSRKI